MVYGQVMELRSKRRQIGQIGTKTAGSRAFRRIFPQEPLIAALRSRHESEKRACVIVQCSVALQPRYRDWRRAFAALLGRFLPRLGPHLGAAVFPSKTQPRPSWN